MREQFRDNSIYAEIKGLNGIINDNLQVTKKDDECYCTTNNLSIL